MLVVVLHEMEESNKLPRSDGRLRRIDTIVMLQSRVTNTGRILSTNSKCTLIYDVASRNTSCGSMILKTRHRQSEIVCKLHPFIASRVGGPSSGRWHVRWHTHSDVSICSCIHIYIHTHAHICTYIYTCIRTCIRTYTHT
jgi:hypothetical protein